MAKAKNINRGDWIKSGRFKGEVTDTVNHGGSHRFPVEIDAKRGKKTAFLGRQQKAEVKRIYQAKPKFRLLGGGKGKS